MIDSNSQFFAILTAVGEAKQANATALGVPWTFKEMAVGDANGTDPIPNRTQTKLINEWRRAPVNQVRTDPANPNIIITEQVIPSDVGGRWIREIGLFDADGDLVAVANCAPSFKPLLAQGTGKTQVIRMNFIVANTAQIVLKIDPAVVLATREYVDNAVIDALAKLDFKHSALVATTANIALSGIQTIDGVLLPADARVLVKNQAQAKDNGLYVVSSTGVWKRAQDADTSLEVTPGLFVSIETGTVNGDSVWQLVTDGPIVLGTTPLAFEMATGRTGVSAGSYANVTVDKYGRVIAGTNPSTLAGHGITDTYTKAEIESIVAQASALPVGSIVAFPKASVPPGFLEIDGSVKSIATYPDLAAYLGTTFNKGDEGAGNFRLPESRGEFLRGWDHGRGADAGRVIGSWQDSDNKTHTHGSTAGAGWKFLSSDAIGGAGLSGGAGSRVSYTADVASSGGSEARPRNLAVMWCIKAWNAPINQGAIDISALAPLATQATEINQGTTKVATTAQMLDSANDFVMPTPKKLRWGFSISLASNGYIALPSWLGGLVLQWGASVGFSSTPAAVTFAMAFPTAAYAVVATNYVGATNVGVTQDAVASFGLSTTGVNFKTYAGAVPYGVKYIAIGS
ncbi:phage-related tail fibre protein-like protein [Pseudomonas sp. Os17]|uniref:phage tail-collar fiber domain-containing protein n=1 Tax=Pseudomonas sp. Os17 TaxID=1500686 RepID=UPI0005FC646D|nr:phage tail protein [Pseudomonas sp. Os17]BAQ75244.1 phage-related tail fibre protein-like protein [Pseudomonas sp. Os17]